MCWSWSGRKLSGRGLRRRRAPGARRRLAVGAVLELEECGVTLVAARGKVRGAGAGVESLCRAASEVLASEVPGSGVQLEPSGAGRLWAAFDAGGAGRGLR